MWNPRSPSPHGPPLLPGLLPRPRRDRARRRSNRGIAVRGGGAGAGNLARGHLGFQAGLGKTGAAGFRRFGREGLAGWCPGTRGRSPPRYGAKARAAFRVSAPVVRSGRYGQVDVMRTHRSNAWRAQPRHSPSADYTGVGPDFVEMKAWGGV